MKRLFLKSLLLVAVFTFLTNTKLSAQTNQYLDFDGINDYVSVPGASSLISGSNALSITGWFKASKLKYGHGMMGFRESSGGFYLIELANGILECRFLNSAGTLYQFVAPAGTVIPNIWQHYAWVYDGTSVKLYLNATLVGSAAATGAINATTIPFIIGLSPLTGQSFYYEGGIDEVTLWRKALTQPEILSMKTTEPAGNEPNLVLYYKFNQGAPGGNNTTITKLHNEVNANSPTYDGDLINFAMTGNISNFIGTVDTSFQAISFPAIPTKLTTSPPFVLKATATSGLQVSYTILSGPATLSNDSIVTVTGAGTVKVKASQSGNSTYDSAASVINTFDVVDPAANVPTIEVRHPLAGKVYMPALSKIQLAAIASINYPSLFSVQDLSFKINGNVITAHDFGNGHYTAWWQPSAYGTYAIEILSTSNYGAVGSTIVNVDIVPNSVDTTVVAFTGIINNSSVVNEVSVEVQLPSFIGAYDTIIANLSVTCPPGGCGAWDYIRSIKARSHEGNWFEVIRYITPYGKACSHKLNVSDYMSILNGKVTFKIVGLDNGYNYNLSLTYKSGTPPHQYSQITQVWDGNYDFGNYANQQPVNVYNYTYPANVASSKIKLISTGHAGPNNTSNAAEFYDATHHIYVNNVSTFTQRNWTTCNPNPDNCSPQSGTWQYSRAGWCPGSIARPFDYDMSPFISTSNIDLKYVFYEQYIDQCNPNYPGCVPGANCTGCSNDVQPYLYVNCNLVNFFDVPPPNPVIQNIEELKQEMGINIYPNPSTGLFNLVADNVQGRVLNVTIFNMMGNVVKQFEWTGESTIINMQGFSKGIYMARIGDRDLYEVKKLIVD